MATQKAEWERLPKVSFFVIKSVIFSFIYLLNPPISWARKVRKSSRFTTTKIRGKERETKKNHTNKDSIRNLPRSTWRTHPWWKRRRNARPRNPSAGQELPTQNQRTRSRDGEDWWISEIMRKNAFLLVRCMYIHHLNNKGKEPSKIQNKPKKRIQ